LRAPRGVAAGDRDQATMWFRWRPKDRGADLCGSARRRRAQNLRPWSMIARAQMLALVADTASSGTRVARALGTG